MSVYIFSLVVSFICGLLISNTKWFRISRLFRICSYVSVCVVTFILSFDVFQYYDENLAGAIPMLFYVGTRQDNDIEKLRSVQIYKKIIGTLFMLSVVGLMVFNRQEFLSNPIYFIRGIVELAFGFYLLKDPIFKNDSDELELPYEINKKLNIQRDRGYYVPSEEETYYKNDAESSIDSKSGVVKTKHQDTNIYESGNIRATIKTLISQINSTYSKQEYARCYYLTQVLWQNYRLSDLITDHTISIKNYMDYLFQKNYKVLSSIVNTKKYQNLDFDILWDLYQAEIKDYKIYNRDTFNFLLKESFNR